MGKTTDTTDTVTFLNACALILLSLATTHYCSSDYIMFMYRCCKEIKWVCAMPCYCQLIKELKKV